MNRSGFRQEFKPISHLAHRNNLRGKAGREGTIWGTLLSMLHSNDIYNVSLAKLVNVEKG